MKKTNRVVVLDDKDELLLMALERNARASVVELARQIDLSRSATQDRLARLEDQGAISAYTIHRGSTTGRTRLRAWLLVRHSAGGSCTLAVPGLTRIPEVMSVYSLAGDPDMLVEVSATDVGDLDRVAVAVRSVPGIDTVSTHLVLTAHFERRRAGIDGMPENLP